MSHAEINAQFAADLEALARGLSPAQTDSALREVLKGTPFEEAVRQAALRRENDYANARIKADKEAPYANRPDLDQTTFGAPMRSGR